MFGKKSFLTMAAAIAATSLSMQAMAWDSIGHEIIAQIAYDNLTPVAQKDVTYLTTKTSFAKSFPTFAGFDYAAPWPDYLLYGVKNPTGKAKITFQFLRQETRQWHFTNDPIVEDGITPPAMTDDNAIWAINYLVPHLTKLLSKKDYDLAAYDLIFITHITGDIHQPLHSAILYDSDFPNGDRGGNEYPITSTFGAKDLHAAWDACLGQFSSWHDAFNNSDHPSMKKIKAAATQIEADCGSSRASDLNPADWEAQSHAIAVNYVYPIHNSNAPQIDGALSKTYITQGQQIADAQLCVAGKRLANVLNTIFIKPIS